MRLRIFSEHEDRKARRHDVYMKKHSKIYHIIYIATIFLIKTRLLIIVANNL